MSRPLRAVVRLVGTAAGLVGVALTPGLVPWLACWLVYDRCARAASVATRPVGGD